MDESLLIDIYRNCHVNMDQNLSITSPTTAHAPPNLTKTLECMMSYMHEHQPNGFVGAQSTSHSIPDMLDRGQCLLYSTMQGNGDDEAEVSTGSNMIEEDDLATTDT